MLANAHATRRAHKRAYICSLSLGKLLLYSVTGTAYEKRVPTASSPKLLDLEWFVAQDAANVADRSMNSDISNQNHGSAVIHNASITSHHFAQSIGTNRSQVRARGR